VHLTAIAEMNQRTISASDLSHFIDFINVLNQDTEDPASSELTEAADRLTTALEAWNRSLTRHGVDAGVMASVNNGSTGSNEPESEEAGLKLAALRAIDTHLSRLILRHSNFMYALGNDPSPLDEHFPGAELTDVRVARSRLRKAMSKLDSSNPGRLATSHGGLST
jgi:hypothetical protein